MFITLMFDVEDFITPESDDIAKILANILTNNGIQGTFMIVGEKARVLERRQRWDVINALKQHDLGLHSDMHSYHPTVAEYLANKGWIDGIAEVRKRESYGVETIQRLFNIMPSAWGQPGGSWGPQVPLGIKQLGIPAIVYSNTQTSKTDIHWFTDVLTYSYAHCIEGFDFIYSDEVSFQNYFQKFQENLESEIKQGRDWMGVFCCHPTTMRAKTFWDELNFRQGINTEPTNYQFPVLKSEREFSIALKNFEVLIQFITHHPQVEIKTIRELNTFFKDQQSIVNLEELHQIAESICLSDDIITDNQILSPSETVDLISQALLSLERGENHKCFKRRFVAGPTKLPPILDDIFYVSWSKFMDLCRYVVNYIDATSCLPGYLPMDGLKIGIGTFYHTLAKAFLSLRKRQAIKTLQFRPYTQLPSISKKIERNLKDSLTKWVIHKPNLDFNNIFLLTRLQTWTLKPAVYRNYVVPKKKY